MEKKLSDLIVGDEVILNFCGDKTIATIDKITNTSIFIKFMQFGKDDGIALYNGRRSYTERIEVATEEKVYMLKKNKLKEKILEEIDDFDFDLLNYDQLKQIDKILNSN